VDWLFAGWRRWLNRNHARSSAGLGNNRTGVALVNCKQDEAIGKSMPDIPDFLFGMFIVLAPSALFPALLFWRSSK